MVVSVQVSPKEQCPAFLADDAQSIEKTSRVGHSARSATLDGGFSLAPDGGHTYHGAKPRNTVPARPTCSRDVAIQPFGIEGFPCRSCKADADF